jgi:hypothetical protein
MCVLQRRPLPVRVAKPEDASTSGTMLRVTRQTWNLRLLVHDRSATPVSCSLRFHRLSMVEVSRCAVQLEACIIQRRRQPEHRRNLTSGSLCPQAAMAGRSPALHAHIQQETEHANSALILGILCMHVLWACPGQTLPELKVHSQGLGLPSSCPCPGLLSCPFPAHSLT